MIDGHHGVHVLIFPDGTSHCASCKTDYRTVTEGYDCAAAHLKPDRCSMCRGTREIVVDGVQISNCPACCEGWVANGTCCWTSVDSPGDHADDCPTVLCVTCHGAKKIHNPDGIPDPIPCPRCAR